MAEPVLIYLYAIDGPGYTVDPVDGLVEAAAYGIESGSAGRFHDGQPGTGYYVTNAGSTSDVGWMTAGAPWLAVPGSTPLDAPIDFGTVDGIPWFINIGLTVGGEAGDSGMPAGILDAGYTLEAGVMEVGGLGTDFDPVVRASTSAPIESASTVGWMQNLISGGATSDTASAPLGVFDAALVDDISDGLVVPYLKLTGSGAYTSDPLLEVGLFDLRAIDFPVDGVAVPTATRQFPRDDTLGFGSGARIYPPLKRNRQAGGFL